MVLKNLLTSITSVIDKTNNFITSGTMWLILPLTAVMLFDVVMRYAFNSPTVWGAEVSLMIFGIYMIYAGPCSVYEKVQVGVDIFSAHWSLRVQAIVSCITYGFTMTLFIALIKTALQYGIESWSMEEISASAWGQPIYHWKMLIPIAISLTFLQTISEFLRNFYMALTGEEL